jgi:gliding motility-associated-like protein
LLVGGNFNYSIGNIERYGYAEYLLPVFTNSSPVIEPVYRSVLHQGSISIYLPDIVTDIDDNLDLSTAQIISQPSSGAVASISNGYLIIDYSSLSFSGADIITLSICDTEGACAEEELTIESGEGIKVFNAISANGDTSNDRMKIENIEAFANNKVTIYNRWGDEVWRGTNYDNQNVFFNGTNSDGKDLPSGTYFYKISFKISFASGTKTQTGFLSLRRE